MSDHLYYEELTALAAGGHLSQEEQAALRGHAATCSECRRSIEEYRELVVSALPLTRDTTAETIAGAPPQPGARDRFLARARRDGLHFSPEVDDRETGRPRRLGSRTFAVLAAAAAVIFLAALTIPQFMRRLPSRAEARQETERLRIENAELGTRLTAREQDLAAQQNQLRHLQTQLDAAVKNASALRRDSQLQGVKLGQSTSQTAQLLGELENRDKQLASASEEIARINQLHLTDRAALEAQRVKLREAFDQVRIATATVDLERQMAAAGKDILNLVLAKQLRVVDVRDTDANGRPSAAFARVFVSEGTSIKIVAFDLNDAGGRRFQVWGEQLGNAKSVRNLGVLGLDDRTQNRWSLTIQNAAAVKDINSVFVTASPRAVTPDGSRLLYAYLGSRPS
jgi:hypothetical protein